MDLREKLAELMEHAPVCESATIDEVLLQVSDHLIANGVTMQEWIPVTERLPDDSAEVNLCTRSRIVGTGFYDKYTKSWVQHYSGGALCVDVTHWMPMPEAPKEG